jgi:hypothetical protein
MMEHIAHNPQLFNFLMLTNSKKERKE